MEQGIWDTIVQIIAGILFLTPLKAMFKRVLISMSKDSDKEPFFQYHFPTLYKRFHKD